MLHTPIVHAHDVSKQIPREKNFFVIFYFGIFLLNNWLRLCWQFELNMESYQQADEEEMFSWNKIINALKHSRRNINPLQHLNYRLKMLLNNWFIHQLCIHWDIKHLGSLESMQEARVAQGVASINSYASFELSKLPARFISWWMHTDVLTNCLL